VRSGLGFRSKEEDGDLVWVFDMGKK